VTGDDVACDEAAALLGPGLRTLAVKRALGRFSARHRRPAAARSAIQEAAAEALGALAGAPVYDPARRARSRSSSRRPTSATRTATAPA
jgi:D-amino peptidase